MIEFDLLRGSRRAKACAVLVVMFTWGMYQWFGNAGAALAVLWGRAIWPTWRARHMCWPLAEIKAIWLWGDTLAVSFYNGRHDWVFGDELPVAEFARVRRSVKSQLEGLL